jgi:hypothetical protein
MPIPLIVVGAALLILILLLLLRIRVTLTLTNEVRITVRALCLRFCLYPRQKAVKWKRYSAKKAAKKAKKAAKKAKKAALKAAKHKEQHAATDKQDPQNKKNTLPEKLRLLRALCAALFRRTHKHLRLHAARLHIRVASNDAATTAVLYGAVCQTLAYLLALLDRITHLKAVEPDVAVSADYLSEKPSADVKILLSVRVGGAILILFSLALAYIRAKAEQKHRRKEKEKKAAQAAREKTAQKG